jgi:hypothetical protein
MTPTPLQGLHAPKVLSLLSFSTLRPLRDFVFLPFSLRWRNMDALLAILLLKQPLAESFRVFSNPVKIPQWILPSNTELKEFSSLLCLSAHCLNAHLAEYLLTERSTVLSFCAPMFSMPTWQSSQNPQ